MGRNFDDLKVKRGCQGLISELLMEFSERPYLRVQFMDIGDHVQEFQLALEDGVSDNTDVSGFAETNRFYRKSITINIDHAYIYRVDKAFEVDRVVIDIHDLPLDEKDLDKIKPNNGSNNGSSHDFNTDGISPGVRTRDDLKLANEESSDSYHKIK